MTAAAVNRLEAGYPGDPDCGLVALSVYLGVSYTDVLRAVTTLDRRQGRNGLWRRTMVRVAAALGYTLKRRTPDEEAYGILVTADHAAVLRGGLVLDRLTVWELDDWLRDQKTELGQCDYLEAV